MPRLRLRLGIGPLALGFALSLSRCGGGGPTMYAYADDVDEPALVLVEDGYDDGDGGLADDGAADDLVSGDDGGAGRVPESELAEPETEQVSEQVEPEPEPEAETEQVEPEPEPEAETEQDESEAEALEAVTEEVTERLDAVTDLLMLGVGALGAMLGYIAFGKLWGPLAGER